ncbi:MAG: integrase arm-type DNA-binding domain-containing protein [Gammaproteobacteria bacterium]|nr:integrase arm-type DNA-binding domain-containing protein [Gammaproteobacteria bacterium]
MSTTSKKQLNFTKKSLEGLPMPEKGKRSYYHDTKCRGLTICIYASGKLTFQLYRKIHGKPERITLGHFPDMTVENARKKAQIVNAEIAEGKNPNDARRALREEMTLRELHNKFIDDYARLHKKSYQADQKLFNLHLSCWENRKLSRITNQDIRQLHQRLGSENGRIVANRVYALLHTMFNKAIEWNLCQGNPASGIKKFKETSRERFLEADEIPAFFQALQLEQNYTIRGIRYKSTCNHHLTAHYR